MISNANRQREMVREGDAQCMIVDPGHAIADTRLQDRTLSPLQCLNRAGAGGPILVVFSTATRIQRNEMLELVGMLKNNASTRRQEIIALLSSRHRELIEALAGKGTDFIVVRSEIPDSDGIDSMLRELSIKDAPQRHLQEMCPYIEYMPFDSDGELMVCKAYKRRLVIGPARMHSMCEQAVHAGCEYFMSPRFHS
jgi:hypothetical protein